MNISYRVATCGFIPERVEFVKKMQEGFDAPLKLSVSETKEHASVWAKRLWTACAEEDLGENPPDWHVLLNDDVDLASPKAFEAALTHAKSGIVSFHTSCTNKITDKWVSCYWATGPGYALRRGVAQQLLQFLEFLPDEVKLHENEDVVMILYQWSHQEPIWSTIPALVRHRTELPSVLGYDNHPLRVTPVPFTMPMYSAKRYEHPDFWKQEGAPPFIENPWFNSVSLTSRWHGIKEMQARKLAGDPEPIMCAFCLQRPLTYKSEKTSVGLCKRCLLQCVIMGIGPEQ